MNILINYGLLLFKPKTNFLIPSSFGYHVPNKLIKKFAYLQTEVRKKLIEVILKSFFDKKNMNIGYIALYIYDENQIAK